MPALSSVATVRQCLYRPLRYVVHTVVDVELARWCGQTLDTLLLFKRLGIVDHDFTRGVAGIRAVPYRDPDLGAIPCGFSCRRP